MVGDVTKPGLSGPEWSALNVSERVALCHEYAREAAQLAQAASPEMRPKYVAIAAEWYWLAAQIELAAAEARLAKFG